MTALPPDVAAVRASLAALGPGRVWRPVPGPDGTLLAPGCGPGPEALDAYVAGLDVVGKSVADLGCNLGYFAFLAARNGARRVLGCDIDPEVAATANLLAQLHGHTNVAFAARDFLAAPAPERFDLALFVDFVGRGVVAKGKLAAVAAAAEAWARREAFFTLHLAYALDELAVSPEVLAARHPGCVRDGRFFVAEALAALLGPDWDMRRLTNGRLNMGDASLRTKTALLFTRKA